MGGVKLIGTKASPFCTRIEWALKLKGVEYEYLEEDLRNKSPILLKSNPVHKKVPVFVHHDNPIPESLVILEYIDETWKEYSLLPKEPYDRAIARFWAKFGDEKGVIGAWDACIADGEEKEKAIESVLEALAHLEQQIKGKKFFGGEQIGYLDLALGWIPRDLSAIEEVGGIKKLLEAERFPSLHEWGQNFMQATLIKECMPSRETLLNYYNADRIHDRSLSANKP